MARSIAFLKFKSTIELEIRAYWHLLSALALSDRVVAGYTSTRIPDEPGNSGYPFKAISISPNDYLGESSTIAGYVRENSLVSFITTFEAYLFELTERIIYLQPDSISDSDMILTASDVAATVKSKDARQWIARKVAEKYLRNKTHTAMIKKIDKLSRSGNSVSLKTIIDDWHKWTLVRNSIVHTTRQVTQELSGSWPSKFPRPGDTFNLTNQDVSKVFSLAIELAEKIDEMAVKQIIRKLDALVLAREIFVHDGLSDPGKIRQKISDAGMQVKLKNDELTSYLAKHKRGVEVDSLSLTATEFRRLLSN